MSASAVTPSIESEYSLLFDPREVEKISSEQRASYLNHLFTLIDTKKIPKEKPADYHTTIENACAVALYILEKSRKELPDTLAKIQSGLTQDVINPFYTEDNPIYSSLKALLEAFEDWKKDNEYDDFSLEEQIETKEKHSVSDTLKSPAPPAASIVPKISEVAISEGKPLAPLQKVAAPLATSERPGLPRVVSPASPTPAVKSPSRAHELSLEGTPASPPAASKQALLRVSSPSLIPSSPQAMVSPRGIEEMPEPFSAEELANKLNKLIEDLARAYLPKKSPKEPPNFWVEAGKKYAQLKLIRLVCKGSPEIIRDIFEQVKAGILCSLQTMPMLIDAFVHAMKHRKLLTLKTADERHFDIMYLMASFIRKAQPHIKDDEFYNNLGTSSKDNVSRNRLRTIYAKSIADNLAILYRKITQKEVLDDGEHAIFSELHLAIAQGTKDFISPEAVKTILHRILFVKMSPPSLSEEDLLSLRGPKNTQLHPVDQILDDILRKIFSSLMKGFGLGYFFKGIMQFMLSSQREKLGSKIQDAWIVTKNREKHIQTVDRISRFFIFNQEPAFKQADIKLDAEFESKLRAEIIEMIGKLKSPISLDSYADQGVSAITELLSSPILLEFCGLFMLRTFKHHFEKIVRDAEKIDAD